MKKLALLAATVGMAVSSYGQGYFTLDDFVNAQGSQGPGAFAIGSTGAAGEGAIGASLGSDGTFATPNYDIGFLWSTSTTLANTSPTSVDNGGKDSAFMAVATAVNGATGGNVFGLQPGAVTGDDADGAGYFQDGNTALIAGTSDKEVIAVQLIAWYDPTGTTSFAAAYASGKNVGWSDIQTITLASGSDPIFENTQNYTGGTYNGGIYTVGAVPEPSTFALAGLGAAAMLIFRRRK